MYETFYQLSQRPFEPALTPELYFDVLSHKKALSYLEYGINQREGFVVLTGDPGVGKTALIAHMRGQSALDDRIVIELDVREANDDGLTATLARSVDMEQDNDAASEPVRTIHDWVDEQLRTGRTPLLLIDDATDLSPTALGDLETLIDGIGEAGLSLQVLLTGDSDFRHALKHSEERAAMRGRTVSEYHLEPMQPIELEPYVRDRLVASGWDDDPVLDKGLFNPLYRATGGIPREVNRVMNELLRVGAGEKAHRLTGDTLAKALGTHRHDSEPTQAGSANSQNRSERDEAAHGSGMTNSQIAAIRQAFRQRDAEIRTLRKDIAKIQQGDPAVRASQEDRIRQIEERLEEQERSLKRVLGLLIERLENSSI